eukprot:2486252-Prymnesium_polylepis.1
MTLSARLMVTTYTDARPAGVPSEPRCRTPRQYIKDMHLTCHDHRAVAPTHSHDTCRHRPSSRTVSA